MHWNISSFSIFPPAEIKPTTPKNRQLCPNHNHQHPSRWLHLGLTIHLSNLSPPNQQTLHQDGKGSVEPSHVTTVDEGNSAAIGRSRSADDATPPAMLQHVYMIRLRVVILENMARRQGVSKSTISVPTRVHPKEPTNSERT